MRSPSAAVALLFVTLVGCEQPTLYIGSNPDEDRVSDERDDDARDDDFSVDVIDLDPTDANVAPTVEVPPPPSDAGAPAAPVAPETTAPTRGNLPFASPFGDAGLPLGGTGIGLTGIGVDWSTWPPRIRFSLSCKQDAECGRVLQGLCVEGRCVECRDSSNCANPGTVCSAEHICVAP